MLRRVLNKLPSSTAAWTCPYFLAIASCSVSLVVVFLAQTTVDLSLLALVFACLVLGTVLGMRRAGTAEGCR